MSARNPFDGAAPESNRPSVGLPHRIGFEVLGLTDDEPSGGADGKAPTRSSPRFSPHWNFGISDLHDSGDPKAARDPIRVSSQPLPRIEPARAAITARLAETVIILTYRCVAVAFMSIASSWVVDCMVGACALGRCVSFRAPTLRVFAR